MAFDHDQNTSGAATKETPSIAILGAGFSGLGMAIRLREEGIDSFTIYEKADDVGGTWRDNTYPGVACDVPSHLYSFSYEPNPNWSRRYSPGGEIWKYTQHCAKKYDLYRSIQFGKEITSVAHDGLKWQIQFADGTTVKADYVISGLGGLHVPNFPEIAGLGKFEGPTFHTAEWRDDVDLTGKRVAVIGSAASAIQVIPEIVDKVAHLDVYQRTPNWVMPRMSYYYPEWVKSLFSKIPLLARAYRGFYFARNEQRFGAFKAGDNFIKRQIRKIFSKHMHKQVQDPVLREKLTPNYAVGCKRILISDNYFPAIQRSNVDLVTDPIAEILEKDVRTKDGKDRPVDVLILATGFMPWDIQESMEVKGPSGQTMNEYWDGGVKAHRTVAIPGFPNFFMLLGPNSGLGHNSVILMIEAQVNYVIKLINQARSKGTSFVEAKATAARAFDEKIQEELQGRVWAEQCGAWYVDKNGRNFTLYPHAVRDYLREMSEPDCDEYAFSSSEASVEAEKAAVTGG